MFSTIKLWLYGIGSAIVAGLYAMLQIKSGQLDLAEERAERQRDTIKKINSKNKADDNIRESIKQEEKVIDERYEELQKKAVESLDDKPLSLELSQLLRDRRDKKRADKTAS